MQTSPSSSDLSHFVQAICLVLLSWDARGQAIADINQPTLQPAVKQR